MARRSRSLTMAERIEQSRTLIAQLAALWGVQMVDMDVSVLDVHPSLYGVTPGKERNGYIDVIEEPYPSGDVTSTVLTIFKELNRDEQERGE